MRLNDLKPQKGAKHRKKRLGNGESSGLGKTCGKGHKGQKSRAGCGIRPGFEGGQMPIFRRQGGAMPLVRRAPKRGFNNVTFATKYETLNVSELEAAFEDGAVVNEAALREAGIINRSLDGIKVLGDGELTKKLTVQVDKVSASAREKIEKAGGSVEAPAPKGEAEKAES